MIYTYLDADKLRYAARVLRFAYNLTMAQVIAFHLSCVIEAVPCFCPQVNVRIWTPYYINGNYSYHSKSFSSFFSAGTLLNVVISSTGSFPHTLRGWSLILSFLSWSFSLSSLSTPSNSQRSTAFATVWTPGASFWTISLSWQQRLLLTTLPTLLDTLSGECCTCTCKCTTQVKIIAFA